MFKSKRLAHLFGIGWINPLLVSNVIYAEYEELVGLLLVLALVDTRTNYLTLYGILYSNTLGKTLEFV